MMNNNDIIRRVRYTFELRDSKMVEIFSVVNYSTTRAEISNWLKKPGDPAYVEITDNQLANFLNGFIVHRRGRKDGPAPIPESKLNNNIILRKLKIALNLKDIDIIDILKLVDVTISKHELSAFFRKPTHMHYRPCMDQMLRNFLHGMQLRYHPK